MVLATVYRETNSFPKIPYEKTVGTTVDGYPWSHSKNGIGISGMFIKHIVTTQGNTYELYVLRKIFQS
jgi:hypothetical protein